MRTFLDIAARNERDWGEKLALREEKVRLKDAYCCELEDVIRHDEAHFDIAVEMLAGITGTHVDDARALIAAEYELRQSREKVAT